MSKRRAAAAIVAVVVGAVVGAGCAGGDGAKSSKPGAAVTQDQRMEWWREARFGMFVHWGLYAIPAGTWGEKTGHGEWIMTTAEIPVEEYEKFKDKFNPVKFDADAWVTLAKDAGIKYIVITSKHHDGFCLFDSAVTEYDVMSTPFQRDIMRELSDACAAQDVRMCWYHSIMDWHHPDYLPRREWETRSAEGAEYDRYVAHMKEQVRELLTNYGPIGIMWFDGEWEETWTHAHGMDLFEHVRSISPATIINNRVDKGRDGMAGLTTSAEFRGDYDTPEQEIPASAVARDWETCMTMNDHWGYNAADKDFKSTQDLIRKLADIASKGGNFLLNVGPTAEGEIPAESVERLREMGAWMKVNGESIYGTRTGPLQGLTWGRCTRKDVGGVTRLYLHVFDWPQDGRLVIPGLGNDAARAHLMVDSTTLPVTRHEDALVVTVPAQAPDANDSVVVLEIDGEPVVYQPPRISAARDIFLDRMIVRMTPDRPALTVRYTTDGSEPSAASPETNGVITIGRSCTVKARAFAGKRPVSAASATKFERVVPRPSVMALEEAGAEGIAVDVYEGEWQKLPDFATLSPASSFGTGTIALSDVGLEEKFGCRFRGMVVVPRDGVYTFHVSSDDGGRLLIGEQVVVNNDGLHVAQEKSGFIALAKGLHPITVEFFERTGDNALKVSWEGPGVTKREMEAGDLRVGR